MFDKEVFTTPLSILLIIETSKSQSIASCAWVIFLFSLTFFSLFPKANKNLQSVFFRTHKIDCNIFLIYRSYTPILKKIYYVCAVLKTKCMNKNYKHKIGIIICWYGDWPWYFKFFLHSVKFNPSIDFLLVTDEIIYEDLPVNIKLINKSLGDIKILATEKMGFEVSLTSAHKLCDFKPAYGDIFDFYLKEYDFWGHGDIDIIFGNIRNFIEEEILENYDVVSVHKDYIHGCFALYKNKQNINILYKCSRDFEKVFSTSDSYAFDECNGLNYYLSKGDSLDNIPFEIESMTHIIQKKQKTKEINAFFNFCLLEPLIGNIRWNKGILTYNNQIETIAYHLYHFKKEPYLTIPSDEKLIGNYFYIGKSGIYIYSNQYTGLALLQRMKGSFKKYIFLMSFHVNWLKRCKKATPIIQKKDSEYLNKIIGRYKNFNTEIIILEKDNSIFVKTDNDVEKLMYKETDFTFLIKEQYLTVEFDKIVDEKKCFVTTDGKKIKHMYYKQFDTQS